VNIDYTGDQKAASQVEQAAKHGDPEAQYTVGMIYKRKAPTVAAKFLTDGSHAHPHVM